MPFLALAGAAVSAAGSVMGGIAQSNQDKYQGEIAMRNAQVAGQQGVASLQAAEEQATETSLAGANRLGQIKTAIAASGVDVNRGSAVDVRASQRLNNALNAATVMNKGEIANWAKNQEAIGFAAQAKADDAAAKNAMFGGILGGAGDLIGGLGKVFSPDMGGGGSGGGGGGAGTGLFGNANPTGDNSALSSSPNIFSWGNNTPSLTSSTPGGFGYPALSGSPWQTGWQNLGDVTGG